MPYSESWPRDESELLSEELSEVLSLLEEEVLPDGVELVDFPLLVSVVLPSFLEDELDFAFVDDDLDPEADVLLLLSLDADEVEPEGEVELESLFAPNPLVVLPDDDELGVLDVLPD
ncbi:hypothetical protein DXT99_10570 [Pontibacter diazotrophicus]|uniref:Uncharacterized protein n=1 Tax=Pontibacter diazotrophicus TaxID=1400979 RepID=A0A3D8LCH5_9BACT|nr:hypothetical protein [Pontibacter diazotrophicus]RDV15108.1 hypothetical protein DXT99_10570 [Pontibacter diazotrophicus]